MALLVAQQGKPSAIKVDSGSEFSGKAMGRWAYENGVELNFSRCETPTDNAMVEIFNGRLRQECPERALVLVVGRCTEQNRSVADVL